MQFSLFNIAIIIVPAIMDTIGRIELFRMKQSPNEIYLKILRL